MLIRAAAALALAAVATPTLADWQKASSRHFVVYSDDTPEHVKTFTTRLELDDKAMRVLHGQNDPPPSANSRVTVIVVQSLGAIAKLAHSDDIAGFYLPRASGSTAFTPRRGNGNYKGALTPEEVLFHEYAHHFMYSALGDIVVPPWLSEGFAEFHATTAFTADGGVTIGEPPVYRSYGIRKGATAPVMDVLTSDPTKLSGEDTEILYGRGWLLTHFFTMSDERRAQLTAYLKALQSGQSAKDAARVFGDPNELQRRLAIYMTKPLLVFTLPAKSLAIAPVAVEPLSPGESAIMPAFILSKRGVDTKTAPKVAAEARQLAAPFPTDAAAQNELAEADYDAHDYVGASAAADRALAADPKSPHALMYGGLARLALAEQHKPIDAKAVEEARGWLRRANRVDQEWAWPLQAYYMSYVDAGQAPTANAEEGLLYARELAPFDGKLSIAAAFVYLKRGKVADARRVLGRVAYDPHGSAHTVLARHVLDVLDKNGSDAAMALIAPKPRSAEATASQED